MMNPITDQQNEEEDPGGGIFEDHLYPAPATGDPNAQGCAAGIRFILSYLLIVIGAGAAVTAFGLETSPYGFLIFTSIVAVAVMFLPGPFDQEDGPEDYIGPY